MPSAQAPLTRGQSKTFQCTGNSAQNNQQTLGLLTFNQEFFDCQARTFSSSSASSLNLTTKIELSAPSLKQARNSPELPNCPRSLLLCCFLFLVQDLDHIPKAAPESKRAPLPNSCHLFFFSRRGSGKGQGRGGTAGAAGLELRPCHAGLGWFAEEITWSREAPAYAVTNSLKAPSPFFLQQQISRLGWKRPAFSYVQLYTPSFIFYISFILTELVQLFALFPSPYVKQSSEKEQPSENCDNSALQVKTAQHF